MAHNRDNCLEELRSDHEKILSELNKLETDSLGYAEEFLKFTEDFAEPHHIMTEEELVHLHHRCHHIH